jgi:hypothetical protein
MGSSPYGAMIGTVFSAFPPTVGWQFLAHRLADECL